MFQYNQKMRCASCCLGHRTIGATGVVAIYVDAKRIWSEDDLVHTWTRGDTVLCLDGGDASAVIGFVSGDVIVSGEKGMVALPRNP